MRSCSIRMAEMDISLSSDPLDEIICDAIVNPTDSSGLMRPGVSRILRGVWGPETELQALYYKERSPGIRCFRLRRGLPLIACFMPSCLRRVRHCARRLREKGLNSQIGLYLFRPPSAHICRTAGPFPAPRRIRRASRGSGFFQRL